ncbi:MAG: tRNA(Ile)(2)-agmatinylcytidine synthase [Thermoplasmatota archaeon]
MWIGLDDTDSRAGGCTTHLAFQLAQMLMKHGFSMVGYPRLVRLNPNIPWKTRGNGAIALQICSGVSSEMQIGFCYDEPLYATQLNDPEPCDVDIIKRIVCSIVEKEAWFDEENTNPGIVISKTLLPHDLYWNAIQTIVTVEDVVDRLEGYDVWYKGYKNRRGLIGASAALSWSDALDTTYEVISYRKKEKWGTKRVIDEASVQYMDRNCPTTFDNYDPVNHHVSIAPNSPCPVLFGIRGENPRVLPSCAALIDSEISDGWMVFLTNQATDDHLQRRRIDAIRPFDSVIVNGIVSKKPVSIPGGHVIFSLRDDKDNTVDCAAYEPTKQFRTVVRQLEIGDHIEVYGGVRSQPLTINIEKMHVTYVAEVYEKVENPVCPVCGKHMKSKGKNQGFNCKRCKTSEEHAIVRKMQRSLSEGFYEVPVCARRHLSKPLNRMIEG